MQLRASYETFAHLGCCGIAAVALAVGMWIAASPMPGAAVDWAVGAGQPAVCTASNSCLARASLGLPAGMIEER